MEELQNGVILVIVLSTLERNYYFVGEKSWLDGAVKGEDEGKTVKSREAGS
jgi:hypothetical protein